MREFFTVEVFLDPLDPVRNWAYLLTRLGSVHRPQGEILPAYSLTNGQAQPKQRKGTTAFAKSRPPGANTAEVPTEGLALCDFSIFSISTTSVALLFQAMSRLLRGARNNLLPAVGSNRPVNRFGLLAVSVFTFLLVLTLLTTTHHHEFRRTLERLSRPHVKGKGPSKPKVWCPVSNHSNETGGHFPNDVSLKGNESSRAPASILPPKKGDKQRLRDAQRYVAAILDPKDRNFRRFDCLSLTSVTKHRYAYLREPHATPEGKILPKYFFALDLHQIVDTLPQLLGSLVEAIKFLGPHNCVLSIVEGRSTDGTYEVLRSLGPKLQKLGVRYFLQYSDIHPQMNGDRIVLLAELRNLALRDIYEQPQLYAPNTTIVFSNDIWLCTEDVLELIHQQFAQGSYMTCGMDYNLGPGGQARFYDGWVARSMTGNSFYKGWWDGARSRSKNNEKFSEVAFWDDKPTSKRFQDFQPVQVYACWNGIVALTAEPFMKGTIRFRGVEYDEDECFQGEPTLLAKDLWFNGYQRTAVVPTINTAYYYDHLEVVRREVGGVSDHLCQSDVEKISWKTAPPEKVKCKPTWEDKDTWVPWNQGLVGNNTD
ncbi:hypothetical protein GRF29_96g1791795 [Pseudopithomyces chartarum]|uniref:Alpha-1,3-mannosyltransferase CMT1 n=1 Tax=Pseudopithomyces chartarum TaxID=1892770 RepID=A0AAN6RGV5_9PLEO|nr:hypothetical protein GRF29_96g1791795 [Pseudopithomyces chartarum]